MKRKHVTLKDVAEKSGVSITTVSHVLNKTRYVKKDTREYVLQIIEELNYEMYRPKSSMRKIQYIAIVIADITEDYSISIIKAIETYANDNGISILVYDSEDDPDKERKNIRTVLAKQVGGMILSPVNSEQCPKEIKSASIPIVLIDRQYTSHNKLFIGINNFESGYKATRYLIDKGCRKIGFIGYTETVYTIRQRSMGYRSCLMELEPEGSQHVLHLNYKREDSNKLIRDFIERTSVDGVICATSDICYYLIGSLQELHRKIPEDMKIITYDDNKWLDYLKYPISVITQPTGEIGIHAVETIIEMVQHPENQKHIHSEMLFDIGFIDRL
ncbi:MAG: LacI family DNA-binding transcriptional regulator [Sphaerochaeta sp.]|nr:LacI family DNA-binding transcriptional regulator [Sphaerochaeta sp.]